MNLPLVVICDDVTQNKHIDDLIKSQPELAHLATIGSKSARQPLEQGIQVIWIELSPDPQKGLALLNSLKESYPDKSFLVSYQSLSADLVRAAMQLGAVEFLDEKGAAKLLPEAVRRIKEKTEQGNQPADTAWAQSPPAPSEKAATVARESRAMRMKVGQLERGYPSWFLPTVLIVVLCMLGAIYLSVH